MASQINASNSGFGGIVSTGDSSGVLQLQTAGTTAVSIDTSQNVGIGTTSPSVRLHLKGSSFSNAIRWEETGGNNNFYAGPFDTSGNFGIDNNSTSGYTRFVTNSTERMRIDSSGRVTMPYQPAFSASSSSATTVAAGALFPFNNELFDRGNNYNPSTYIFTAPVSGYYFFMATFYLQGRSSICFKVNGSEYGSPTPLAYSASSDQYDTGRSMSFIVSLSANDTVSVASRSTESSVFFGPHSNWLGYLLG